MFFNAHALAASKIFKSKSDLLLIGSVLSDIAITGVINWDDGLHGKGNSSKFAKFLKKNYPNLRELGEGVIAHNILDRLSHEDYKGDIGYAFQNNKDLVNKVKKYYRIDENASIKIAHNYIESAVDILLLKDNPEVFVDLKKAINITSVESLSKPLAKYFERDERDFRKALKIYFKLITKYNLIKIDEWVYLWQDLGEFLNIKKLTTSQIKELLNISLRIVGSNCTEFLDFAIKAS